MNGLKNNKKLKRALIAVASAIGALALLAAAFFGGYFTKEALGATSYDWVLSVIQRYYYDDVDISGADEVAIDALVEEYLDMYSEYYTAEEYEAQKSEDGGNRSGLGITYSFIPGTGATVLTVLGNSPAYLAGIRPGDVLVSAEKDGEVVEFGSASAFSGFVSGLEEGEEAKFSTSSGEEFVVAKAEYVQSYVTFATNENGWYFSGENALTLEENGADAIEYIPEGTGYICLSQFYGEAPAQFRMAVSKLKAEGCTAVILDLRNDGGGYASVMGNIAGCFSASAGKVAMLQRFKNGNEEVMYSSVYPEEYVFPEGTQVYVLANSSTASASEALIGALISYGVCDYGDIYISEYSQSYLDAMGMTAEAAKSGKTYGKGIMQSTYRNIETGEALKLTTAKIFWPNGKTIHDSGLSSSDGCNTVQAPAPLNGDGEELKSVVAAISAGLGR